MSNNLKYVTEYTSTSSLASAEVGVTIRLETNSSSISVSSAISSSPPMESSLDASYNKIAHPNQTQYYQIIQTDIKSKNLMKKIKESQILTALKASKIEDSLHILLTLKESSNLKAPDEIFETLNKNLIPLMESNSGG
jgi:hypothetical protein